MHIKHMHEMIEKLTDCTKSAMEKGDCTVGKYPIGDCVDMIKDLNEAEYYAHIVKAMKEAKEGEEAEEKYMLRKFKEEYGEDEEDARRHYDRWRYDNGRFAPKGRGHRTRMGYMPHMMDMPWDEEEYMPDFMEMAMGYTGSGRGGNSGRSGGNRGGNYGNRSEESSGRSGRSNSYGYDDGERSGERNGEGSRYGRSYDNYRSSKRHYTENPTEENKRMVDESADEAWEDVEDVMKKIYNDAEPQNKAKLKQRAMQFIQKLQ